MADFLLFEGPVGYSLFKVVHQPDSAGNRLKEVQDGVNDLSKFGKLVELSSFLPFEYDFVTANLHLQFTDDGTTGITSRP